MSLWTLSVIQYSRRTQCSESRYTLSSGGKVWRHVLNWLSYKGLISFTGAMTVIIERALHK